MPYRGTTKKSNLIDLTSEEKSIILGSLLGDASICLGTGQGLTARVSFEQGIKQREYIDWKYDKMKRVATSLPRERTNKRGHIWFRFYTKCIPYLRQVYDFVTLNGRKTVTGTWLREIKDPLSLAVWYMDDGHISKSNYDCKISTEGFNKNEVELLCHWLESQWKIDGHPISSKNKYWVLRLTSVGRDRLFDIISPHVIPTMFYKILRPLNKNILSKQKIQEAIEFRKNGLSFSQIAKIYNVHVNTIRYAIRGINWKHLGLDFITAKSEQNRK